LSFCSTMTPAAIRCFMLSPLTSSGYFEVAILREL
jgi:hypothetical protein